MTLHSYKDIESLQRHQHPTRILSHSFLEDFEESAISVLIHAGENMNTALERGDSIEGAEGVGQESTSRSGLPWYVRTIRKTAG
jgi:hypothetical protein